MCADGGGKITDHYVNGLLRIAEKAVPAIPWRSAAWTDTGHILSGGRRLVPGVTLVVE